MRQIPPLLLNSFVLIYIAIAYGFGIGLLVQREWRLNLLGVVLVVHVLILSATLTHEFIHGNIFKQRSLNFFFGQLMTHINGACYAPYQDLVQHHFNHHVHHADFVPFEISIYCQELPPFVQRIFVALEWCYFPIFEFMLRWHLMIAPWQNPKKHSLRWRTLILLAYRGTLFGIIGWFSGWALLLYALSYVCFVNLMRFADAFHHTYDYVVMGAAIPKRDRVYEQENTFSNLVSIHHPWLNLLYLNFGYHNAHHHDMRCPWYRLPQLHQQLYGEGTKNLLPLPKLVANYHRFRLQRLFGTQGNVAAADESAAIVAFTGGIGVSFLTPP